MYMKPSVVKYLRKSIWRFQKVTIQKSPEISSRFPVDASSSDTVASRSPVNGKQTREVLTERGERERERSGVRLANMSFDARDWREKFSINRCTRVTSRNVRSASNCSSRSHREKRLKLITFGVNDRFAVVDGTIDCSLDTIKSRSLFSFSYYYFFSPRDVYALRWDVDNKGEIMSFVERT